MVQEFGLDLKKTSNNKGGEYHSACPACREGKDRFVIWPQLNRYWCRRCDVNGDAIQFCRDFLKMSFHEACERINDFSAIEKYREYKQSLPKPEKFVIAKEPPKAWQAKALAFVEWSHKRLVGSSDAFGALFKRGVNESTINQFKIGFCKSISSSANNDLYREREDWGLTPEYKEDGKLKKLWLPTGLVIPTMSKSGCILKIKVRRQQWQTGDSLPKYVEISGSMQCPSIYGETEHSVVVVVESELDALLIHQNAKDICFCIALGGVSKKPDLQSDQLLRKTKLILWSLDNDEAGKNAALWWRTTYKHLKFWPASAGKSPGDAFKDHEVNIRDWLIKGIEFYSKVEAPYENTISEVVNYG